VQAELQAPVTIIPDASTNSLLIRATEQDFELIRQAVEQMDVRPLQVLIEVVIAEIRRDALTQLGLEVLLPSHTIGDNVRVEGQVTERILGKVVLRIMQLNGAGIDALFEALSQNSNVSIISRPVLVTLNNEEAHFMVGSQRPFIQVARTLPTEAAVRDQVIQYRDVGTKLTILPTINYDGYVTLRLLQEVSAATAETQFGAPIISTREASTQLFIKDGQTVVIGGFIESQRERTRSGIPLLKDLPIVGALFGSSSWRSFETELFLFVTPRILATDLDAEQVREGIEGAFPILRDAATSTLKRTAQPDTTARPDTSSAREGHGCPECGSGLQPIAVKRVKAGRVVLPGLREEFVQFAHLAAGAEFVKLGTGRMRHFHRVGEAPCVVQHVCKVAARRRSQ
jgi:general secretion pathway protein D